MPTTFAYWSLLSYYYWCCCYNCYKTTTVTASVTVAIVTIAIKLSYYCATDHSLHIFSSPSVVELITQQLILPNILWLRLCRINKFGLNTLTSKTVEIPYTCGLSFAQHKLIHILQHGLSPELEMSGHQREWPTVLAWTGMWSGVCCSDDFVCGIRW